MKHTTEITKPKSLDKIMRGEFEYSNGILSLTCHTQNVSFAEALEAITKLRDECQRQIDNQEQCPFHKEPSQPLPKKTVSVYAVGGGLPAECGDHQSSILGMIGEIDEIVESGDHTFITLSFNKTCPTSTIGCHGFKKSDWPEWLKVGERVEIDFNLNRITLIPDAQPTIR